MKRRSPLVIGKAFVRWWALEDLNLRPSSVSGMDTVAATREAAEDLAVQTGGGKVRSRAEMLTDPEHPGLAQALMAWESGDDSAGLERRGSWAESVLSTLAEKRAELRWGMIDLPDDVGAST